jgi:hypothetical protein
MAAVSAAFLLADGTRGESMADLPPEMRDIPESLRQAFNGSVATYALSWLGRMMWHVSEVQRGRRRFFSLHLVWEVFTAIAIAYVAEGLAVYFGLSGKPALGGIVGVSYLGPRGVEALFARCYGVSRGGRDDSKTS